ncbi:MAG: 1-acyl-sn-glycerol-3-phosphate acyltransferase [Rickettsiales bacterium]|jgi:1-acyl-sn-glycerol-3-phosphate acyltransferase|nr:1-acyl-sn-glycerol-3-phosphate acyltransferase [Rickettsiales bacterium]
MRTIFGYILSIGRIIAFLILSLFLTIAGYTLVLLKKNTDIILYSWWKGINLICGIKVKVIGKIDKKPNTVFVSNHISYWDITSYGEAINPTFISKKELKNWPIFGTLAKQFCQIHYMDRRPSAALKEKENINKFIKCSKRNILFFPEGTTTDGGKPLPFKAALFENFLGQDVDISLCRIKYAKVSGKPVTNKDMRRIHAWYNEADLRYSNPNILMSILKSLSYRSVEVEIKQLQTFNMKKITDRKEIVDLLNERLQKEFAKN